MFNISYLDLNQDVKVENESTEQKPDFSHLSDDNPVKKLCMEHPNLSTCQRFLKPDDAEDADSEQPSSETPSSSTASYIKSFTRWMNSCLYTVCAYFVECIRSILKITLYYTVGVLLSVGGKGEVIIRFYINNDCLF